MQLSALECANCADLTRQLAEAKAYNAEWIKRCRKFRLQDADEADAKLANLRAELSDAREELADIKDSYRRVMEEKCPTDEVHCTCVPALRAEIARLRKANESLVNAYDKAWEEGYNVAKERFE